MSKLWVLEREPVGNLLASFFHPENPCKPDQKYVKKELKLNEKNSKKEQITAINHNESPDGTFEH